MSESASPMLMMPLMRGPVRRDCSRTPGCGRQWNAPEIDELRWLVVIERGVIVMFAIWICLLLLLRDDPCPASAVNLLGFDSDAASRALTAGAVTEVSRKTPEEWGALGNALMVNGFHREATLCFGVAERLAPDDGRWPYLQGVVSLSIDTEFALNKLLRGAHLSDPANLAPRIRVMHALLNRGRIKEAAPIVAAAIAEQPGQPLVQLAHAKLAAASGQFDEALTALEACKGSSLTARVSLTLISGIQAHLGDSTGAEKTAAEAAALPRDQQFDDPWLDQEKSVFGATHWLDRAERMIEVRQTEDAVALMKEVIRQYPHSATAWQTLGRACIAAEDHFTAETALTNAEKLDPNVSETSFLLGKNYYLGSFYEKAADCLRRAIESQPNFGEAHYNLGLCLEKMGDPDGAIEGFRDAIRFDPNQPRSHHRLGSILISEGRDEEAVQVLREALELEPESREAQLLLQEAESRVGRTRRFDPIREVPSRKEVSDSNRESASPSEDQWHSHAGGDTYKFPISEATIMTILPNQDDWTK